MVNKWQCLWHNDHDYYHFEVKSIQKKLFLQNKINIYTFKRMSILTSDQLITLKNLIGFDQTIKLLNKLLK